MRVEFAPIAAVQTSRPPPPFSPPSWAFLAAICALTACKTTSDRFDLYSPDRAHGPATERLREMTLAGRYDHKSSTHTYVKRGPVVPEEGGPAGAVPPVPPVPGAVPETNSGAPQADAIASGRADGAATGRE